MQQIKVNKTPLNVMKKKQTSRTVSELVTVSLSPARR